MKIVIDIPEEEYEKIKASPNKTSSDYRIINGTLLPENGKIVDMEDDVVFDLLRQYVSFGTLCDLIDEMPSILDKKEGE